MFGLELGEVVDAFLEGGIDAEVEGDEFGGGEGSLDGGGDFLDDDAAKETVLGEEFAEGVLVDEAFVGVGAGGFLEGEGFHGAGGAEGIAEAVEEEGEVITELWEGEGFGVGECFADGGFPAFEDGFLAGDEGVGDLRARVVCEERAWVMIVRHCVGPKGARRHPEQAEKQRVYR